MRSSAHGRITASNPVGSATTTKPGIFSVYEGLDAPIKNRVPRGAWTIYE